MDSLITEYFHAGFAYLEIIELLKSVHGYEISLSTLKRRLNEKNLRRRPLSEVRSSEQEVREAVRQELIGSGSRVGYRRVYQELKRKGLIVRKHDVRLLLKELDPEGVMLRKRRRLHRRKYQNPGPSFTWHIDGYDKLKYYGFSIHGCIDGFSRKLLWLNVSASNKDPNVVAKFYLDTVHEIGGTPLYLNADDGTEHAIIEPMHIYLSSLHGNFDDDDEILKSFKITSSPKNQRIEAYWSSLRRDKIGWWKEFFEDMNDLGFYDASDFAVLECMRFCFIKLIRKDLL